jgi:hypothetical protein
MNFQSPSYQDTLNAAVEEYKKNHPEEYKRAQLQGEIIMSLPYDNLQAGLDQDVLKMKVDVLLKTMKEYDMTEQDLDESELKEIRMVYPEWK